MKFYNNTLRRLLLCTASFAALAGAAAAHAASTPYTGSPISLPSTWEAENFDRGGQNVGYSDKSTGNLGGQYRTAEDVDIIVSSDPQGGGYVVNNFQTGEWMAYTVTVASAGTYNVGVRASST